MSEFPATDRTKVRRKPDRGSYDRELIYSILDEAFVCQVAVWCPRMCLNTGTHNFHLRNLTEHKRN